MVKNYTPPCIWCGQEFINPMSLQDHIKNCSSKDELSKDSWAQCGYCPSIFFFKDLKSNPFFIAHMNNFHGPNVDFSWGSQCFKCKSIFPCPEASEHHTKICFKKDVPFIPLNVQKTKGIEVDPKIVDLLSNPLQGELRPRAKPNSQLVTVQPLVSRECALCAKIISGKFYLYVHLPHFEKSICHVRKK